MKKLTKKKILCICVIAVTLLCTVIVNADFHLGDSVDYSNSLSDPSYEPTDIEPFNVKSTFKTALPGSPECHKHKISVCRRKISVYRDALITIEYEIKNSDSNRFIAILTEICKCIFYDPIKSFERYIS